jgi:hypothetical protein
VIAGTFLIVFFRRFDRRCQQDVQRPTGPAF